MDPITGCPASYEDLFKHYWVMVQRIVGASGIASQDVEDVSMEMLALFMEKEGLSKFDPLRHSEHRTVIHFRSMLRGFVSKYVLQYRDKQMIRMQRTHVGLDNDDEPVFSFTELEFNDTVQCVRKLLADTRHKRDLVKVFDTTVEAYEEGKRACRYEVADALKCSPVTANKTVNEMRDILTTAGYGRDSQIWR